MSGIKSETKTVTIYANGREVCHSTRAGKAEYQRRREEMWNRDHGTCCLSPHFVPLDQCTFEHFEGRGMSAGKRGGSKRDDRVDKNGISCWNGNIAKGSMSLKKYLQKPLWERIQICRGN